MFTPLGDRILVRRDDPVEVTASGILLPEAAQKRPQEGIVVAIGPGFRTSTGKHIDMGIKIGDRVLFAKHTGTETAVTGEPLLLLREADIYGVYEAC